MSLINDMLRDLEARGAPAPRAGWSASAGTTTRPRRTQRRRVVAATLLLLAAIAASLWLLRWASTPPAATVEAPTVPIEAATQPEPVITAERDSTPVPAVSIQPLEGTVHEVANTRPVEPATPELPTAADAQPAAQSPALPVTAAAPPTSAPAEASALVISRVDQGSATPRQQTRNLQAAADALAAGRDGDAEQILRDLLADDADAVRARLALAALYQRQGRDAAATAQWRAGLERDRHNAELAEALARALIAQGQPANAASVLATAAPPVAQQPDFHALLAYAWQQAGQSLRAAEVYRALVAHDASQGRWWLGLATAEEARGDAASALAAFHRARDSANLETSVLRYVDQRIAALEATSP